MPADFERCVRQGGKVRTRKLSGDRYQRICTIGGKTYDGEVKQKKVTQRKKAHGPFN